MSRRPWPEFFMNLAYEYASMSTCCRASVGCIIVKNGKRQIGAGFNGPAAGEPHCTGKEHECMVEGHCAKSMHAEENAVLQALELDANAVRGADAYVTTFPCWPCYRRMKAVGIQDIYVDALYRTDEHGLIADFMHRHSGKILLYDEAATEEMGIPWRVWSPGFVYAYRVDWQVTCIPGLYDTFTSLRDAKRSTKSVSSVAIPQYRIRLMAALKNSKEAMEIEDAITHTKIAQLQTA